MNSTRLKYSILITTFNRKKNLRLLLDSISKLTIAPFEIIVASAGESVVDVVDHYRSVLNIKVLNCDKRGQVFQKKQALINLDLNKVEWILFCDDDISIDRYALDHFTNWIDSYPSKDQIGGVGFDCVPNKGINDNRLFKLLQFLFLTTNKPFGAVKKNGHITNYMQSDKIITTNWLNSGSIWRVDTCKKYNVAFENVPHALGEDLIFSYSVSKAHKLIYFPPSKIYFQTTHNKLKIQTSQAFRTRSYHMLYFVLLNDELSSLGYLWTLLGRTVYTLIKTRTNIIECRKILSIFFDIIMIICLKKNAEFVLEYRIKK